MTRPGIKFVHSTKSSFLHEHWDRDVLSILESSQSEEWRMDIVAELLFADCSTEAAIEITKKAITKIDPHATVVIGVVPDSQSNQVTVEGLSDFLVYPFRAIEVESKLRAVAQMLMWKEVIALNQSYSELIHLLKDDLTLAERLQKSQMPERFPNIKGFKVQSRFLAGMKSGGDYFDLAEATNGSQLAVVLTDSSSYGLSSAVLSALMRVSLKIAADTARSSLDTVKSIFEELLKTLGAKDTLSVFYGLISRQDLSFRYVNFGTTLVLRQSAGGEFEAFPPNGHVASQGGGLPVKKEEQIFLKPGDRLVLLSDGFIGNDFDMKKFTKLAQQWKDHEAKEILNDLVFNVKSRFESEDDMPEQDCTALVIETKAQLFDISSRTPKAQSSKR